MITITLLFIFFILFCVFAYIYTHRAVCGGNGGCGKAVWTTNTDASPTGPNPLGVRLTVGEYKCRNCGKVAKIYREIGMELSQIRTGRTS